MKQPSGAMSLKDKKTAPKQTPKGAYFALLIAFLALLINFWAWSLLSPISGQLATDFDTTPLSLAVLLSTPVIIGSLGRVLLGVLTDKFGGKLVFIVTSLFVAVVTGILPTMDSYSSLIAMAALLGFGGATFSIGIPYISAWFPATKRGLAIGIYSLGNAGTALSGLLTPPISNAFGFQATAYLVAALLVVIAIIFALFGANSPSWRAPKQSVVKQTSLALKSRLTWDLASVYAVTFGAYVAFGVYLPVILSNGHSLSLTDAAARAAGFVLVTTLARPVGGFLSDKIGGKNVIPPVLFLVVLLSLFIAFQNSLNLLTTVAYLSLAFVLGCGSGAVFALIGRSAKPQLVGSIGGIVGAIGGLGGFLPPMVLGLTYQQTQSYMFAYIMLSVTALLSLIYVSRRFKDKRLYPAASSWR